MTFFKRTNIEQWQAASRRQLRHAFSESRKRSALTRTDHDKIRRGRAFDLLAVNSYSRLLWGRLVSETIAASFCDGGDGEQHDGPIYLVSLMDIECARSRENRLSEEDLRLIKNRLRIGLIGSSYLGMVEPAYYVNLQAGVRFRGKRCMFWHLHALVWGIPERKLKQRLRKMVIAGRYVAIAPDKHPTDVRTIKQGTLPQTVAYVLKSPDKGYRVAAVDAENAFGESLVDADGVVQRTFRHNKEDLRPGERIDVFHAMKHLTLDQLAIAGGAGAPLLRGLKLAVDRETRRRASIRPVRGHPRQQMHASPPHLRKAAWPGV